MTNPGAGLENLSKNQFPVKYDLATFEKAAALKAVAKEIGPTVTVQFFRLDDPRLVKEFTERYMDSILPKGTSQKECIQYVDQYTQEFSDRLGPNGNELAVVMFGPDAATLDDLVGAANDNRQN